MLEVLDLSFDYSEKPLLNRIGFSLNAGELLYLQGENGVGKTTLLKLIAGLFLPREGDIHYQGASIYRYLPDYQQKICYVGYKLGLSLTLTVRENCLFDLHYRNQSLSDLFEQFNLTHLADVTCGLLSAGQRRRVALLRLLMSNASLWLLDEPFTALDQTSMTLFSACLNEHLKTGGQVILTSHQALPAELLTYREYCLNEAI